jgi:hypothetical protein
VYIRVGHHLVQYQAHRLPGVTDSKEQPAWWERLPLLFPILAEVAEHHFHIAIRTRRQMPHSSRLAQNRACSLREFGVYPSARYYPAPRSPIAIGCLTHKRYCQCGASARGCRTSWQTGSTRPRPLRFCIATCAITTARACFRHHAAQGRITAHDTRSENGGSPSAAACRLRVVVSKHSFTQSEANIILTRFRRNFTTLALSAPENCEATCF